jgi:hypothetical protein
MPGHIRTKRSGGQRRSPVRRRGITTATATATAAPASPGDWISPDEGRDLFDAAARRHLGMSGDEFRAAWHAGKIEDPDRSVVLQVAMLLPFVED